MYIHTKHILTSHITKEMKNYRVLKVFVFVFQDTSGTTLYYSDETLWDVSRWLTVTPKHCPDW